MSWSPPFSRPFSRCALALLLLAAACAGCGPGESGGPASPAATPAAAAATEPTSTSTAAAPPAKNVDASLAAPSGRAPQAPTPVPTSSPTSPPIAAPTPEQLARWTPAPFEPLQLRAIFEPDPPSFSSQVAALADGKHFVTAGSRVLLWSVDEKVPIHTFLDVDPADPDRHVLSLAAAPNGQWIAAGDSLGAVHVWRVSDREELAARKLLDGGIQSLAISPDGEQLAVIAYDNEVSVWSADSLAPLKRFKVDADGVKRIEYSAPAMLAVAGNSTALWNTESGEKVRELSPGRYDYALARSPDGARFVYGGGGQLHVWNVAQSKAETALAEGASGRDHVAFSPDGQYIAASSGRSVVLWNLADGRVVQYIDGFGWPIVDLSWLPETNLLAVASDSGCTRLWGATSAGVSAGLKPLHPFVELPDPDADLPASPYQLEQLIDLRTLPRLPDCKPSIVDRHTFHGETAASPEEIKTFYAHFLGQQGWQPAADPSANPAAVEFRKEGFAVTLHCYDSSPGQTQVMLSLAGNYDLRRVPRFDAAPVEVLYEGPATVSYRTDADILAIETSLLRKLQAAGWTPYALLNSSSSEQPDQRDLAFLRNGATLRVTIGKFPTAPSSYTVQYSLFPTECSVPVPADAGFVEFDGSTEPVLVATTAMNLDECIRFYDEALTAEGWLVRPQGRTIKDEQAWLGYIRGQCNLTVGLSKLPDGRTLVQVGDAGQSLWKLSQQETLPADEADADGLEAADFPVLNASKTAKFDPVEETIELTIDDTPLAAAAERYIAALQQLGWTAEEGGIRDDDYTMIDFSKEDQEFTLRARLTDGNAVVSVEGDGLRWKKTLPGGKQVVSYETWLRQNKRPPTLDLLDQYQAEMESLSSN